MARLHFLFICAAAAVPHVPLADDESCTDTDAATSFLQLSKNSIHGGQASSLVQDPVTDLVTMVRPFKCNTIVNPVQMLKSEDGGFAAKELNVETGKYSGIFDIPQSRVDGGYEDLNACGVNPADSIVYCGMKAPGGAWIVRIDPYRVEFVVKVPARIFNTGGFSPAGDMFLATGDARFIVVQGLNTTKGFSSKDAEGLRDESKLKVKKPTGFNRAGDCVIVYQDLEKTGTPGTYLITVYGPELYIAKWTEDGLSDKTWVLKVSPQSWDNVYGAGWNYQGKIMFASNNGRGVYQIPLEDLDLSSPPALLEMKKIGKSDPNGNNDGLNCLNGPDPWTTQAGLFDCAKNARPYQVIGKPDGYAIGELDFATGDYNEVGMIWFNMTSPPYKALNAAGINPEDGVAYGALKLKAWDDENTTSDAYVVRFNKYKIEFVAKILGEGRRDAIAGTFDKYGTFYVLANPLLYGFKNISLMPGFKTWDDASLPEFGPENTFNMTKVTGNRQIADIVVLENNFDGQGDALYMTAVNSAQDLAIVKISKDGLPNCKSWLLRVKNVTSPDALMNWGAAWNFQGNAYFAQNDGIGIFRLATSQIKLEGDGWATQQLDKDIDLTWVGKSRLTHDNDGLNCWQAEDPFMANAGPERL
mmetsp:Transcript_40973/g.72045  ORF Transcript_40973/g.72045 Transcript_40973/m.72045 type:complete len:642 (+) Transcript_40973:57-1982(+)